MMPQFNPLAKSIQEMEKVEGNSVLKGEINTPFPLSNRLMIDIKYVRVNRNPGEHLMVISEEGNNQFVGKYISQAERKSHVLAHNFVSAWWIIPIKNDASEIVASRVLYCASADIGGSIPKAIADRMGPGTAYDATAGLIKHIKKIGATL